jgi:plastocyanin
MNLRSRITGVTAAAFLVALVACGDDDDPAGPGNGNGNDDPVASATVTASSSSFTFSPSAVNLQQNGTVTWNFGTLEHNVVFQSQTGAPANIPVTTNSSVQRTFGTTGSFPYSCTVHPGMNGTIHVH